MENLYPISTLASSGFPAIFGFPRLVAEELQLHMAISLFLSVPIFIFYENTVILD